MHLFRKTFLQNRTVNKNQNCKHKTHIFEQKIAWNLG